MRFMQSCQTSKTSRKVRPDVKDKAHNTKIFQFPSVPMNHVTEIADLETETKAVTEEEAPLGVITTCRLPGPPVRYTSVV